MSGGSCLSASVTPPKGQEWEECVCRVSGVFGNFPGLFQTPLLVDVLDGRERCPSDALGSFHNPLQRLPDRGRTLPIPNCDSECDIDITTH